MTQSTLYRNSGISAILSGIFGIAAIILNLTESEPDWFYVLFNIVILISIAGIFLSIRPDIDSWGVVGITVCIGGIIIAFLDFLLPDIMWRIGSMILGVGLILLSVGLIKSGKLTRWAPVFWILAPIIGVPGLFSESLTSSFIELLATLSFVIGFIGAGYGLLNLKT